MRKAIFASATSAVLLHFAPAMLAQVDVKAADLVITERGAHHTAWQYIESRIDALTGQIFDIPRNFTELATGLNFQDESG